MRNGWPAGIRSLVPPAHGRSSNLGLAASRRDQSVNDDGQQGIEGLTNPADLAIVGDGAAVQRGLDQLRDAGVTDFMAVPCGNDDDQKRTIDLLSELARA